MYNRRKVLLALVESFGGELSSVDCQKLMFLFCQRTGKNYYDFFPYRFGGFSITLAQDQQPLVNMGYLRSGDSFRTNRNTRPFLSLIDEVTREDLIAFASDMSEVRGDHLIRSVYKQFPFYASRSEIASKLLPTNEIKVVEENRNLDCTPRLFTIGYEGISIDAYLNKLIANNVLVLADVRKNPLSQKYGFSKNQLRGFVEMVNITYVHIPDLGIPSNLRQNLDSKAAYESLFALYDAEILPRETNALADLRKLITEKKRVALTCFEADFHSCHRARITGYLEADSSFDIPVIHL